LPLVIASVNWPPVGALLCGFVALSSEVCNRACAFPLLIASCVGSCRCLFCVYAPSCLARGEAFSSCSWVLVLAPRPAPPAALLLQVLRRVAVWLPPPPLQVWPQGRDRAKATRLGCRLVGLPWPRLCVPVLAACGGVACRLVRVSIVRTGPVLGFASHCPGIVGGPVWQCPSAVLFVRLFAVRCALRRGYWSCCCLDSAVVGCASPRPRDWSAELSWCALLPSGWSGAGDVVMGPPSCVPLLPSAAVCHVARSAPGCFSRVGGVLALCLRSSGRSRRGPAARVPPVAAHACAACGSVRAWSLRVVCWLSWARGRCPAAARCVLDVGPFGARPVVGSVVASLSCAASVVRPACRSGWSWYPGAAVFDRALPLPSAVLAVRLLSRRALYGLVVPSLLGAACTRVCLVCVWAAAVWDAVLGGGVRLGFAWRIVVRGLWFVVRCVWPAVCLCGGRMWRRFGRGYLVRVRGGFPLAGGVHGGWAAVLGVLRRRLVRGGVIGLRMWAAARDPGRVCM